MVWKSRARRSLARVAACALVAMASALGRAQVPPTSGAGVLLGTDDYGHSVASPIGWDVYSVGGLRAVLGAPFSGVAMTKFTSRATDGRRFVHMKAVWYYRDGQGRVRIELDLDANHPLSAGQLRHFAADSVLVIDPVRSERYMLFPLKKSGYVLRRAASSMMPLRAPVATPDVDISFALPGQGPEAPDAAAETVALGEKEIDGIRVVGGRRVHVIRVGELGNGAPITATAEQWFSPALGIVVMHSEARSTDFRMDEMHSRLYELSRAEPDPALFTVLSGYTRIEVDPAGPPPPAAGPVSRAGSEP